MGLRQNQIIILMILLYIKTIFTKMILIFSKKDITIKKIKQIKLLNFIIFQKMTEKNLMIIKYNTRTSLEIKINQKIRAEIKI